jgi:hypothetical protein
MKIVLIAISILLASSLQIQAFTYETNVPYTGSLGKYEVLSSDMTTSTVNRGDAELFKFDITSNFTPLNINYGEFQVVFNTGSNQSNLVNIYLYDNASESKLLTTSALNLSSLTLPYTWSYILTSADLAGYVRDDGIFSLLIDVGGGNNRKAYLSRVTGVVPIPAAAWLLGTGVIGLVIIRRKKS